ncbi:hypothetical protein [Chromobacterium phragmitis]|uniref:hypothetical protein n=1 Tax=Chromobacterium phragmitis TaxID=2202141 RepID=UPI0011AE4F45|nr:hypothetical protein [Chromobacterium phragmitis]
MNQLIRMAEKRRRQADRKKIEYENKMKRQEATYLGQAAAQAIRGDRFFIYGTSGGMNANQRVIEQFANQDRGSLAEWLFYGESTCFFLWLVGRLSPERRKEIMTPYEIGPNLDAEGSRLNRRRRIRRMSDESMADSCIEPCLPLRHGLARRLSGGVGDSGPVRFGVDAEL